MKLEPTDDTLEVYALGTADAQERATVERGLLASAAERSELDALTALAAQLALAVPPVSPPEHLRTRLLEKIAAVQQPLPFRAPTRRTAPFSLLKVYAIAASFTLATFLVLLVFLIWRMEQLGGETDGLRAELSREREMVGLLTSPDSRTALLAGTPVAPTAQARLIRDSRTGDALLTVADLPVPPQGKTYQLWLIADGKPVSAGVFRVDARGRASQRVKLPSSAAPAPIFAVSLEPIPGVSAPTGDIFLKS